MTLPVSVGEKPVPWQVLGLDVFELVFQKQKTKARFLLMTCLVMRLTSVQLLWQGDINQIGTDSGEKMVHAFTEGWLLHRPRPEWCLVDPQTGLSKGAFPSFCHSAGIGVAVTPGEAHWQHGATESMVKSIKATMRRIRNERPQLAPKLVGALASLAENHTDKVKGYTPVQWAYGSDCSQWHAENDPLEVNNTLCPLLSFGSFRGIENEQSKFIEKNLPNNELCGSTMQHHGQHQHMPWETGSVFGGSPQYGPGGKLKIPSPGFWVLGEWQ